MSESKKTAIVILNWNGEKLFQKYLPSVIRNSAAKNVEIWVADNNSTDNSIDYLKTNFPTVEIIELDFNY
jgi:GT2 family glycosyltransferase